MFLSGGDGRVSQNGEKDLYDDIIDLPHHVSKNHSHMSIYDRAAQFSPFAALTGYDQVIEEEARITETKIVDEGKLLELNEKLNYINDHIKEEAEAMVTFFIPDVKKEGGSYCRKTGIIKKIDVYDKILYFKDGEGIDFDNIYEISILKEI
ncbi:MAG: hypothetical protein K5931_10445 [Lachnospiraceae bacterium]|nr:hypothetical protein [Lachnospiraceae bacterium]